MTNKTISALLGYIPCVLFGVGIVFIISPLFLYWWIHGDYDRYLWIIKGPYPYSNLGSASYQLLLYGGLFFAGILFIIIAFILRRILRNAQIKKLP